jgi:hypothetical protein
MAGVWAPGEERPGHERRWSLMMMMMCRWLRVVLCVLGAQEARFGMMVVHLVADGWEVQKWFRMMERGCVVGVVACHLLLVEGGREELQKVE